MSSSIPRLVQHGPVGTIPCPGEPVPWHGRAWWAVRERGHDLFAAWCAGVGVYITCDLREAVLATMLVAGLTLADVIRAVRTPMYWTRISKETHDRHR